MFLLWAGDCKRDNGAFVHSSQRYSRRSLNSALFIFRGSSRSRVGPSEQAVQSRLRYLLILVRLDA